ncbi:MAG: hypothetical protein V2B20_27025, partial [Pseudomonadota bacterium]
CPSYYPIWMERFSTYCDIKLQKMEKMPKRFPLIAFPLAVFHLLRYYSRKHGKSNQKQAEIPTKSQPEAHGSGA